MMSSTKCLCRSSTVRPPFASSSAREPTHSVLPHSGHRQIGMGFPQKRLREIAQSRASGSQLPNLPVFRCAGIQVIASLAASIAGLIFSTLTNHDPTAL